MARLLVAGLLGAAALTPLLAQPAPVARIAPVAQVAQPAPMAPMPMAGRMAMTLNRADVQARVQASFAKRDANRDGFLTADELAMGGGDRQVRIIRRGGGAMSGDMPGMGKMPGMGEMHGGDMHGMGAAGDPNALFDRLDGNHDGQISRAEFASHHQMRIEQRVIVRNGGPGQPGGMRGMRGMRQMHGGGMIGAALLKRADANHDGRVSLAEATGAALQHFDMMDSNRDGRITPQERAAGRQRMMQMHGAG